MKIIKEIEKSRLTEDTLNELKGGVGENCSSGSIYQACGSKYSYAPCAMKLSCGGQYYYCTGPQASQKTTCPTGYWVEYCIETYVK
ncbi:MAG: hypothetical protein IJP65_04380 [Bacteroidales bacterium]|nr:hypothetical protein [Bacteroidales bacterium]